MNYDRIYRDFIADRRGREAELTGYTERHHIVPRSLGGTDDASNLITLTAEDHYFAHCCLAKIHGGKMWSALWAVAAMAKTARAVEAFGRRRMVAAARLYGAKRRSENMRELWATGQFNRNRKYRPWTAEERAQRSRAQKGRGPGADAIRRATETVIARAPKYVFEHRDGRRFAGTASQLWRSFGLYQSSVSRMVNGKLRTVSGWRLVRRSEPNA